MSCCSSRPKADRSRPSVERRGAGAHGGAHGGAESSSNHGFGGLDDPNAWFQCTTADAGGAATTLRPGLAVMIAVLPQGIEVRDEVSGELVCCLDRDAISGCTAASTGVQVAAAAPDGELRVLALDTEFGEQIAHSVRDICSGGGGDARADEGGAPPGEGDALQMEPHFVGYFPDGTQIGIAVDQRGLALIELEHKQVVEYLSLFMIRGWGFSDDQVQVQTANSDGSDDILTLETYDGAEIVERLKHFAAELATAQDLARIEDEVGLATPELPAGWATAVSQSTGDMYYINTLTNESTYDRPTQPAVADSGWEELPEGWEERISRSTGHTYYVHLESGHSTYDRPELVALAPQAEDEAPAADASTSSPTQAPGAQSETPWWKEEELGPPVDGSASPEKSAEAKESQQTPAKPAEVLIPSTPADDLQPDSPATVGTPSAAVLGTPSAAPAGLETEPASFPMLEVGVARVADDRSIALTAHAKDVLALLVIPPLGSAGASLATGGEDGTIRIWRGDRLDELTNTATLQKHTAAVRALATFTTREGSEGLDSPVSPRQRRRWLASGGADKAVRLWQEEGDDWECQQTLIGHTEDVNAIEPVSTLLATGSDDMSIRLWSRKGSETGDWRSVASFKNRTLFVTALARVGKWALAAADGGGNISVWSIAPDASANIQPKRIGSLTGHTETVWALASYRWRGQTRLLATSSADKTLQLWHQPRVADQENADDPNPPQEKAFKSVVKFRGLVVRKGVNAVAFVDSGVDESANARARWDLETEVLVIPKLRLVSGGNDGTVTLWALQYEYSFGQAWWNYSKVHTISISGGPSTVHALSQFGEAVAVGRADGVVTLLPPEIVRADTDDKPAQKQASALTVEPSPVEPSPFQAPPPKTKPDRSTDQQGAEKQPSVKQQPSRKKASEKQQRTKGSSKAGAASAATNPFAASRTRDGDTSTGKSTGKQQLTGKKASEKQRTKNKKASAATNPFAAPSAPVAATQEDDDRGAGAAQEASQKREYRLSDLM